MSNFTFDTSMSDNNPIVLELLILSSGVGNYSDTWIECYSISHVCSTVWSTNGTDGEPVCDLAPQDYVTKDRLYCPERANITGAHIFTDLIPTYCKE